MNITEEVRVILDEHLIGHGSLKLNVLSQSKHHAVTDYKKVYVKVLKPGTISTPNVKRLKTEVDFAFATNYGTNPLLESIFHKNSKGHNLILSAWEFEQQIPIIYNLNPVQIAQAANELYKIHSFPHYEALRHDANDEYDEYVRCLTSHSFQFLSADHQNKIKHLYKYVIQPGTDSLTLNPELNVVSHGQATLEKAVKKETSVEWVDYEEVRSAPREYDASSMFLQLQHRLKRPELWQVFRKQYEDNLGRPLNDGLLEQFASLHLARRALELGGTTLHTMNQEKLMAFLQELTKLVAGKRDLGSMDFTHFNSSYNYN